MVATPMTTIVAIVLATLLVVGLFLIIRSFRDRSGGCGELACPRCRAANPGHARFCARCGQALT
ncbi:MAG: hypothetical protein HY763_12580 [Planctomycetes bacterium]|nr:hypothetical protein [Planctomycetota bacterium]